MLQNLDVWDYVLLGIAIVVSVYSLVVLMNRRYKLTVERLREQVEAEAKKTKTQEPRKPSLLSRDNREDRDNAA